MPTKTGPHTCKQCSEEFMGQKGNKNDFCCPDHFNKYRSTKEKRSCEICGAEFMVKKCDIKRGRGKYCGRSCQWIAIGNQQREEKENCILCGNPRPHKNKKYCGKGCYALVLRKGNTTLTKEEYQRVYNKFKARKQKEELRDHYVVKTLANGMNISDVPRELIELKRLNIKRKRLIKTQTQKK